MITADRDRRESLKQELKNKFVYLKLDAATQLRVNYLGLNLQIFCPDLEKPKVITLGVTDIKQTHGSTEVREMLEEIGGIFELRKEQILACFIDNAANMTKPVEKLNNEWVEAGMKMKKKTMMMVTRLMKKY